MLKTKRNHVEHVKEIIAGKARMDRKRNKKEPNAEVAEVAEGNNAKVKKRAQRINAPRLQDGDHLFIGHVRHVKDRSLPEKITTIFRAAQDAVAK